jgi:thiol-disulfide isomerase/thioredoxin
LKSEKFIKIIVINRISKTIIGIVVALIFIGFDGYGQVDDSQHQMTGGFAVIKGKVFNLKTDNIIEVDIDDWAVASRRQYFAEIDSLGNFMFSLYIFNTQDVLLVFQNRWHAIFIAPNDTLSITIDADNFPVNNKYEGTYSKSCADYLKYRQEKEIIFTKNNLKPYSEKDYKLWRDSIFISEERKLHDYSDLNNLDSFFKKWLTNDLILRYKIDVIKYYLANKDLQLDANDLNSIILIDTVFRSNSSNYSEYINILASLIARPCNEEFKFRIKNILNDRKTEKVSSSNRPKLDILNFEKDYFKCFAQSAGIVDDTLVKEILIAHMYLNSLRKNLNIGIDLAIDKITDPRIKTLLLYTQNKYDLQHGSYPLIQPSESNILSDIKNKYKGHVIYVEFWSVWCSPCLSLLTKMKEEEKKIENKDVKFVYLCCRSDKNRWEKIVNELKLKGEHILLTSEEYAQLSTEFDIVSVPKSIKIDREGNITPKKIQ